MDADADEIRPAETARLSAASASPFVRPLLLPKNAMGFSSFKPDVLRRCMRRCRR
jgi:hypothetical protein